MSLREQAYHQIRKKIVSLDLPPGATIDEAALQHELDLGRTPIREALLRLSEERLVTIIPRRGMFVTDIGITDLKHIYEIRVVLEPLAVELATKHGTAHHWQKMATLLSNLPPEGTPDAVDIMIDIDEQCHQIIYRAAQNKFLEDTLTTLYALSLRLWYFFLEEVGTMHPAIKEHQAMLDAMQASDEARAARLMEEHIATFHDEIQTAMLGQSTSPPDQIVS